MKKERLEIQILIDSINSLAEAVEMREEQMARFNLELEDKVNERTRELNEKNQQLEIINNYLRALWA
jgi:nitrate/nitrite-specific signal transduction histidine kinase